jgi:hypothetical protein
MRKGYDVRSSEWDFIRRFADFVADNASRFDGLLSDGERVCGEWMIKTHSLFYEIHHEPFEERTNMIKGQVYGLLVTPSSKHPNTYIAKKLEY